MATRIKKTDLARDALYDKVNVMIDEVNTKIDNKDSLPSQTGNTGKFLTTDGANASWGEVKQIEIKQDLTNPSTDTVPSTKAVSDESSRITTLMDNLLSTLYPVGSIYIGAQNNCPLATLIAGSQWQIVSNGRALWGGNGSNANSTIEAGLPNITGQFSVSAENYNTNVYGSFGVGGRGSNGPWNGNANRGIINFDASRSSSIYGKSNTVQPPAYIVNVWIRTA